jgi:hypothetical protein
MYVSSLSYLPNLLIYLHEFTYLLPKPIYLLIEYTDINLFTYITYVPTYLTYPLIYIATYL